MILDAQCTLTLNHRGEARVVPTDTEEVRAAACLREKCVQVIGGLRSPVFARRSVSRLRRHSATSVCGSSWDLGDALCWEGDGGSCHPLGTKGVRDLDTPVGVA
jgi:hypothetical protein